MNILIFGILLIFSVNLTGGKNIPLENNKINILGLQRDIGATIKEFLEGFRNRMCHEIPNKGIPKLDPFGVDKLQFDIDEDIAKLDVEISNLSASGLAKFDFPKLKFNALLLKIDLELVLPKIVLTSDYKIKGSIKDLFDLNGDGDVRLEVDDIKLILKARILFIDEKFSFKFQELTPSIEKIKFRINNLFPVDELNDFVSELVSDMGVELLNDAWDEYGEDVKSLIEMLVTGLLEGLTVQDLLDMLGNLGDFFDENDPMPDCGLEKPQVLLLH